MRNSIDRAALNWLLETTALRSCARGIPIGRLSVSAILGLAAAGGVMAPKPASAQFACASDATGEWTTAGTWSSCNSTYPNNGGGNTYDATVSGSNNVTLIGTDGAITIETLALASNGSLFLQNGASFTASSGNGLTIAASSAFVQAGLYLDTVNAQGGSTMTVGGTLTNNAQVEIGNTNLSSNDSVTTSGLVNNGYVQLEGSSTAQASLVVHAPATDPLTDRDL